MGACGSSDSSPTVVPADHEVVQAAAVPMSVEQELDAKLAEDYDAGAKSKKGLDPGLADQAIFSWLDMAPPPGSACAETLQRCFPGALPGTIIVQRVAAALTPEGFTPENTIYGQSLCPDEINHEKGGMSYSLIEYWGECFPMGGIGGAPYVGKTGFTAFSHHVPDNGHVLICFGPHIGISENGELGKVHRVGQEKESGACGAVLAAYDACQKGASIDFDMTDMQQSWLKAKVKDQFDSINSSSEPLASLIRAAYDCVLEKMMIIVNNDFGDGSLVLLGGIQLNMPKPYEDHFQPLMFELRKKDGSKVDLLPSLDLPADGARRPFDAKCRQLMSWACWSPPPDHAVFGVLERCFPGYLPGPAVVKRSATILSRFGLDPENTIYGQSLCPDEINHEKGGMAYSLIEQWGECFPMGGIGGAPFVGKTGFGAFSHHVPDGGHVMICFGPHIAISDTGELGKVLRQGQSKQSGACGAVLAAYEACKKGDSLEFDMHDMQQSWLKSKVQEQLAGILGASEPLEALIHAAYASIEEQMLHIVNNGFGEGHLVLLGGIQLNLPRQFADHFQPLMFKLMRHDGTSVDLLPELLQVQIEGQSHMLRPPRLPVRQVKKFCHTWSSGFGCSCSF